MPSLIHHTFGPHVTGRYILRSIGLLCMPWRLRTGKKQEQLRTMLHHWFDGEALLFGSGRDALLALLRSLPYESGSEIIVQGYTCIALPNAIHAAGYTPVFADIDPDTLNIDLRALKKAITPRTKAVIVQHTFGMLCDTEALKTLCDAQDIAIIEDCAHMLPDVTGPKTIGKYSDYLMLSFGRDKAVSGIAGGAIIVKHQSDTLDALQTEEKKARPMRLDVTVRLLLYPIIYGIAKPLYTLGIGKVILWVSGKVRLLPPVLTGREKCGFQSVILRKIPNACAALTLQEFKQLHSINNHRRRLTARYLEAALSRGWHVPSHVNTHFPLQKFPIIIQNPDAVRAALKRRYIYLEDGWTGAAVCPRNVHMEGTGYVSGSCINAEKVARSILTLPTHPTMTEGQAARLVDILIQFL